MTQEEKLKEAKRLYESANADQRYVLESLFPELKESEGEEIRKEIIAILKYKYEKFPKAPRYSNVPKWIAWLEKQGEHNSFSWIEDDEIKVKAMCEEGNLKPSEREWLKNLRYRVTKKKSDVFTERDRNIINNICENIQGHFKFSDVCKEDAVRYLRSLEGRMQSKKGLTDEDYKVYKSIIDDAVNKDLALTSIQKEWLKSLEERVQPMQELSEGDRKIIIELIGIFESAVDGGHVSFPYRLIKDYIRVLKSCLPQSTWKPSDEQIKALDEVYKTHGANNVCRRVLFNLMNDLKKLREE